MMDIATCAMTFRLLRMNGYDVSSGTAQLTYLEFPTAFRGEAQLDTVVA